MIDLDEIERLHAAAGTGDQTSCELTAEHEALIAFRNAFPALLAELRARRRQVNRLTSALSNICEGFPGPERRIAEAALDESSALDPAAPAKGGEGRNPSETPNSSNHLQSGALAGVTPEELRCLAADIHINANASPRRDRAAAILRDLADTIEQTEAKP